MVGLVLVSHSKKLAESVRELVLQMTAPDFPVAVASGAGEDHKQLGTDAVHIAEVLGTLIRPEGVLVLMDLGSAVLSAQTALELLASHQHIQLCAAPLVEGAVAAAVQAAAGGSLDQVSAEAQRGLLGKQQQLGPETPISPPSTQPVGAGLSAELVLVVNNEHGLHARPAARLVTTASQFSSTIEVFNLTGHRGPAPARSLTSIALLQVNQGDRIRIVATGADRQAALQAIHALAASGFGDDAGSSAPGEVAVKRKTSTPKLPGNQRGVPASDGIAIGQLLPLETASFEFADAHSADPAIEIAKLIAAIKQVRHELKSERASNGNARSSAANEILAAQSLILADPVLLEAVQTKVAQSRVPAARAWIDATEELASQYAVMHDDYLRDRAVDVRDIARRVFSTLLSCDGSRMFIQPETPAILYTGELLPSEAAACDPDKVLGVISREGSATSHSAILLRTLGIPMVVGVGWAGSNAARGKTVALDGGTGELWIEPDASTIAALQLRQEVFREERLRAAAAKSQPSVTLDGVRVQVLANASSLADASAAIANGAEGIGLLRTEFLFLSRAEAPSEQEQTDALRTIIDPVTGPVVVRTLDAGADKPLRFLLQTEEHNPFLGLRGIRLSLLHDHLFSAHLRAILAAGVGHDLWVMFPMISTLAEARRAKQLLESAHLDMEQNRQPHVWPVKMGIMIEVPSAALLSDVLAEELDFFSIGTNDLTQYVMAAERGNAALAELQDPLHPAVLRLIKTVVDGAATHDCHVSVCGDAASDRIAAAILVGLGIRSLSVRPRQAAEIKAVFRDLRETDLQQFAERALQSSDASQVRKLVSDHLESKKVPNRIQSR